MSDQLTEIPKDAFRENRQLKKVHFSRKSQLTCIRREAFCECASLQKFQCPTLLTAIGDRAFYRCKSLSSVQFPEGLTHIGSEAFYYCGFKKLHLPSTLRVLGDAAFFKCVHLTHVVIPESVRHIGKWVFHGCSRLEVVEIRHDPDFIGDWIINRSVRIRCYRGSKVDAYCQHFGFTTEYIDE